jgi:cyclohexadieny/prephenate dehydrogenase
VTGTHLFERITIVGLGLIGSSIARAARTHYLAKTIVGCDQNELSLAFGINHNIIDIGSRDVANAVADSQLIVLATPPGTLGGIVKQMAPALKAGTIVTDTASVKQPVIAAIRPHLPPKVEFIPAHPIAGSEQSGVQAGRADLFHRKLVIITPESAAPTPALQNVTSFWKGMGARLDGMPAELHDTMYAYISHLPHLLAFAAHSVIEEHADEQPMLRQFLRLGHSNAALWSEVFVMNKNFIIKALDRYLDVISHIKNELGQAPAESKNTMDEKLAQTVLFPRIAASCLVTTVMEAEKNADLSFIRYIGTGFADFTSPATVAPEVDMERISDHYAGVAEVMEKFVARLAAIRAEITAGNLEQLQEALVA